MKEALIYLLSEVRKYDSYSLDPEIDIEKYTEKLISHAMIMTVYEYADIVSFIAFYSNDYSGKTIFISMLATNHKFRGKGMAKLLVSAVHQYAATINFIKVRLQVDKLNTKAISLYNRMGYEVMEENESFFIMQIDIQ